MFSPFQSTGQPPRPIGPRLYGGGDAPPQAPKSALIRAGQFQNGGAPLLAPPVSSTLSGFLGGSEASPFDSSDMTDSLQRNWQLLRQRQELNPAFARGYGEIGKPTRRDYSAAPFIF